MATYIWITQQYIKTFTPINQNVDSSDIAPHIETAQLINTREILGKNLYDDLEAKQIANTLTPIEEELVEIVKQALAYRSAEIAIPFLSIKIRNKGTVRMRDEFAEPASVEEMKYLRSALADRAEYFEKRAMAFLCQFSTDFPLYTNDTTPHNQIYPNHNNPFDSDIYLGGDNDIDLNRGRYLYGPNGSFPNRKY